LVLPVETLRIIALTVAHLWVVHELGSWISVLIGVGVHIVPLTWALSSLFVALIVVESGVNIRTEPGLWLEGILISIGEVGREELVGH